MQQARKHEMTLDLWSLKIGETAQVDSIPKVDPDSICSGVLSQLGIKEGSVIRCLHKTIFGGPRIYEANGVVFTLCKQASKQVLLHPQSLNKRS